MKDIKFTKEQFLKLLKAFYIGEYVINGYRVGDDKVTDYEEIEQLLYRHADELGFKELILKEEGEPYLPSGKFEFDGEIRAYMEDYDNESFWDELVDRFADKLTLEKFSLDEWNSMEKNKKFSFIAYLEYNLKLEFQKNYLDNLKLLNSDDIVKNSIDIPS